MKTAVSKSVSPFSRYPLRFFWLLMTLSAAFLSILTFEYFSLRTDINFLLAKQEQIKNIAWMTAFYMHISGSLICLFVGPFQFIAFLRKKYMSLHRTLGRMYIITILFIGGPSGLFMAFFANGGTWAQVGFFILALLWFFSTYLAYVSIRNKKIQEHKKWMVRSYALTFSAVTLRTWVPVLSLGFGVDHDLTIILTAWINWIPNVLLAELILYFFPKSV